MANNIIRRVWNQNRMVNIEDLTGAAFQAESGGHTFEISGIDDTGAAVELSGTVSGVFRRPDNADIALTGSASNGVVSVTLSEDCYAVPGRFGLTIFVTSNSQKVAVYACVGTVAVSSTGNVAGDTPANVEDLIDDINAAIADLNSAIGQIPASYANVMAAIAPTYSGSALYSVGSYAWYNGSLYRCTTPITTAEAWTAAHWTAAVLGDDVGDLKSAVQNNLYKNTGNLLDFGIIGGTWQQGGYNNSNPYQCKTKIDIAEGKTVYGVINNSKMIKTSALSSYTLAMYVRAFDSSDIQIGNEVLLSASSSQVTASFTTPQNTSYVLIILSSGVWGNQFTPQVLDNAVEAFAYVGYDNISYTDVSPNFAGYPEYNNELIQKTDGKVDALESKIPSMKDIESIAANGYKTISQFPTGTTYNWGNTSTALSPDDKISNAYKLNKCALEIATAGVFKVGLYTASGTNATVTHVKEITAGSTGVTEFDLDFLLDPTKDYYFFVLAVSGAFKFSAVTTTDKYFTIPSSAVSVGGTGTITTASGNGLALGTYNIFLNITVSGKGNTVTVAKSGGDYTTIQEAVNHTTTETIIVYPGIYDEVVIVPNSGGRNIIGVDREKCIIRSQSGKYADTPLKIYGDFYLANMTLIATADEAESWYPTWDSSDPTTFASYAIHIDGWTNDWNGAKGIVRNCTFYSECNHAAGCGVQKGYTLEFENCEFIRNVTDEHYLNSNYDGAMGVHSPNVNETGATGEHLIMRDCTVINKNHLKALQLFHVFLGASLDAEIKGCTFKDSAGIDNVIKFLNCTNAIITDMSHGNSTDECNYRAIHQ